MVFVETLEPPQPTFSFYTMSLFPSKRICAMVIEGAFSVQMEYVMFLAGRESHDVIRAGENVRPT